MPRQQDSRNVELQSCAGVPLRAARTKPRSPSGTTAPRSACRPTMREVVEHLRRVPVPQRASIDAALALFDTAAQGSALRHALGGAHQLGHLPAHRASADAEAVPLLERALTMRPNYAEAVHRAQLTRSSSWADARSRHARRRSLSVHGPRDSRDSAGRRARAMARGDKAADRTITRAVCAAIFRIPHRRAHCRSCCASRVETMDAKSRDVSAIDLRGIGARSALRANLGVIQVAERLHVDAAVIEALEERPVRGCSARRCSCAGICVAMPNSSVNPKPPTAGALRSAAGSLGSNPISRTRPRMLPQPDPASAHCAGPLILGAGLIVLGRHHLVGLSACSAFEVPVEMSTSLAAVRGMNDVLPARHRRLAASRTHDARRCSPRMATRKCACPWSSTPRSSSARSVSSPTSSRRRCTPSRMPAATA